MTNRYSINYSDAENAVVLAAAKAQGDDYTGRWIGKAALAFAHIVLKEKKGG